MQTLKNLRKKFHQAKLPRVKPAAPKLTLVPKTRKSKPTEKPWPNQYLEGRAVDVEFAKANNVELHDDRNIFVKHHPLTRARLDSSRTRHRVPPLDKDDKPMKFTQRRHGEGFPYFPVHWDWSRIFTDTSIDLYIVESECSALALAQRGVAAIGVGGCDGVFMAGTRRQKLHPIFSEMVLKGRKIYIVFDADTKLNKNVHDAEQAAAKLFGEAAR
jgi:hypothetical protein